MKRRQYDILLHPLFLAALFLLLLNDASLKYEFHNEFTGKLSDFAGLFVFAIFWMALLPKFRWQVIAAITIFFVWWKSPLSSPFIQSWNSFMPLPIARVIDYGDLAALVMLPLAYLLTTLDHDSKIRHRRLLIPVISCITLFAFCFTTPPRYGLYYSPPGQINFYGQFDTRKTEQQLVEKLVKMNISVQKDSVGFYPLRKGEYYIKVNEPQQDSTKWIRVNGQDSTLYIRTIETPFYIIPSYNLDGHELKDVKLIIEKKGNRTYVHVQTFQLNTRDEYSGKLKKKYKQHFRKLFE